MLKLGTILPAALLAMLPVLPLAAQEQYGGINGNGTAAFDPGWIFIYYANTGNWNSLAAEEAAQAREARQPETPAVTVKKTSGPSAGWYAGISGGVPFGVSAYSSFP